MTDRRLPRRRCGRRDAARAHFAQLQATVNDADSGCTRCGELFSDGGTVEVVILRDGTMTAARLAHPECARSGVYAFPGLRAIQAELLTDGLDITTTVGRRAGRRPHALVLIELMTHLSMVPPGTDITDVSDPLADYAATLGLEPISGRLDQITPTSTTTSRLHVEADTLWLIHPDGQDIILDQDPHTLAAWTQTAADRSSDRDRHHRPRPRPHPTAHHHHRSDRHPTRVGRPSHHHRLPPTPAPTLAEWRRP